MRFTCDTCVIIYAFENPNMAQMMKIRLHLEKCDIFVSSVTIAELQRKGFDAYDVIKTVQQSLGIKILVQDVTDIEKIQALAMASRYPKLHSGDREILAFSLHHKSTLLTCDKGLIQCCNRFGGNVINPHQIATHRINRNTSFSRFTSRIRKMSTKYQEVKP